MLLLIFSLVIQNRRSLCTEMGVSASIWPPDRAWNMLSCVLFNFQTLSSENTVLACSITTAAARDLPDFGQPVHRYRYIYYDLATRRAGPATRRCLARLPGHLGCNRAAVTRYRTPVLATDLAKMLRYGCNTTCQYSRGIAICMATHDEGARVNSSPQCSHSCRKQLMYTLSGK